MSTVASQITSLTIVYSNVYSGANERKTSKLRVPAFVQGIHRGSVNFPHKRPVTRKRFPFDEVIISENNADLMSSQRKDPTFDTSE